MNASFQLIAVFNDDQLNYRGNTSVVIELAHSLPDRQLREIAADLNQPATTFLWQQDGNMHVRWFAPDAEIDLCGHGSMAAAAYLQQRAAEPVSLLAAGHKLKLQCLDSQRAGIWLEAIPIIRELPIPDALEAGLGKDVHGFYKTNNKEIVLLRDEEAVRSCHPDFARLRSLDHFGYAITAAGEQCDFVSRTLVPHVAQLEDAATGSSHAALTPFWSARLRKHLLSARQLSRRGGAFQCSLEGSLVHLVGKYKVLARGEYQI